MSGGEDGFVFFHFFFYIFCTLNYYLQLWDWDNDSIPLEPLGLGPPKFVAPGDKHSVNEG